MSMVTIGEFASKHKVSKSLVLKWIRQKRITAEKKGKLWLVTQTRRPKTLGYGGLTTQQRKVWPRAKEPDLLAEVMKKRSKKDPKFKKLVAAALRRRKAARSKLVETAKGKRPRTRDPRPKSLRKAVKK